MQHKRAAFYNPEGSVTVLTQSSIKVAYNGCENAMHLRILAQGWN